MVTPSWEFRGMPREIKHQSKDEKESENEKLDQSKEMLRDSRSPQKSNELIKARLRMKS